MDGPLAGLTFITALGCGLNAGVLFAFSTFVMKALARLQPPQGLVAMQSINEAAVTPAFMTLLFGTALACVALAVWALVDWDDSIGPYVIAASALYLVGTIGVTVAYHVPRNEALAAVDHSSPHALSRWARYRSDWTKWNHVRVVAALAAAAVLTEALHVG